jgi:hypothetical protein
VEHVVLGLLHHRFVQVVALGDLDGGQDIARRPFGSAPIKGLTGFHDVVHSPDSFFDGGVRVGAVSKDQIHVVQLEALQRSVDGL